MTPDIYTPVKRRSDGMVVDRDDLIVCKTFSEREARAIARALNSRAGLVAALCEYVKAQGRMLDKWSEGDDGVKHDLWVALHKCEEPARAALAEAEVSPSRQYQTDWTPE